MTRRTKEQRERDRADLLAILEEAEKPMRTDVLIATAYGLDPRGTEWWRHYSRGYSDLRALARMGVVTSDQPYAAYYTTWSIGGTPEADELEDRTEVSRMLSRWEPAP